MQRKTLTKEEILAELKVIEAAKKDPSRFGPLYERYYRQIFTFVYKRAGAEELTADITSQVFLKALVALPKFKYKGVPFSAWLYRIASNEVSQHFRGASKNRTISMDQPDIERVINAVAGKEKPEPGLREVYLEVLIDVLDEMDEAEVQLIELRFFEKRPFSEVAYILGITENNAKVKTYRLLERMKKKMTARKSEDQNK